MTKEICEAIAIKGKEIRTEEGTDSFDLFAVVTAKKAALENYDFEIDGFYNTEEEAEERENEIIDGGVKWAEVLYWQSVTGSVYSYGDGEIYTKEQL